MVFFLKKLLIPCQHVKVSALGSSSKYHQAVKRFLFWFFFNIYKNLKMQISSVSASVKKYNLRVNNYVHVKVLDIFLV